MAKNPNEILLGPGVFYINEVPIGLTRGGSQFVVEREFRPIAADGDKGKVKGRITKDTSTPKLTVNAMQIINENLPKMYAATKSTKDDGHTTITGKEDIEDSDYIDYVKWVGETKGGKGVRIKVFNAINLENLDWSFVEKDETIATLTYEGCYEEDSEADYEPWEIEFDD